MKIALIGPGIMDIPPPRWGAVEMVIWDTFNILNEAGHEVVIVNLPDTNLILDHINANAYDVIHLHYDVFAHLMPHLKAKVKILSSHYPFISDKQRYVSDGYDQTVKHVVNNKDYYIFASSQNDINSFVSQGADSSKISLSKLGVKTESYSFLESPVYNKTLCFSQIVDRKRQYQIQNIDNIDFVGRIDDYKFTNHTNYRGEYDRQKLNEEITKYTNFILLSKVENTTPLAVKEALICGLGVVVTDIVAQELDLDKEFITVLSQEQVNDLDYLKNSIANNKLISLNRRREIREYGINNFDYKNIILNQYVPALQKLLSQK
jgi:hypothetical protein